MIQKVRTRIAPSPTGFLHVGTARTALFNWLFARKHGGKFIVRVEDTDVERSRPEFEEDILKNLLWLGLEWDEGPTIKSKVKSQKSKVDENGTDEIGDYGPYRQSRRGEVYKKYLEELYEEGHLYRCFCTAEELEAMRQDQAARGEAPRYTGRCRELSKQHSEAKKRREEPLVLRFKVPAKQVIINDVVRGKVEFDTSLMGDTVIARDFTHPLFHFAVVVDDFAMEISHVIRGEDLLPSTPLHALIQQALGFPTPAYAHIPLILGPDRAKLSKRHGATAMAEYRKAGYLPEAMINFLALLGWHPETNQEVFASEELLERFSLERIQKSAAVFNVEKLRWLNGEYMKKYSDAELAEELVAFAPELKDFDQSYLQAAASTVRARARTLVEIRDAVGEFYTQEPVCPPELFRWKDMDDEQVAQSLEYARHLLEALDGSNFTREELEKVMIEKAAEWGRGDRGKLLWPLRVALSGKEASPGPFEIAAVLGKEKTLQRVEKAIVLLGQH